MNARGSEDRPIKLSKMASKAHHGWKRITVTFTVDVLAFVFFVLLVASGLITRYALPPGSGSLHGMGGPSAGERPITLIWGLTRHEWGDLHFYMAAALIGALALYLFQHWRWIAARVRGQSGRGSGWHAALGIVGLVAILGIAAAPFLSPKEQVPSLERSCRNGANPRTLRACEKIVASEGRMQREIPSAADSFTSSQATPLDPLPHSYPRTRRRN